jgi:hypothetical protein
VSNTVIQESSLQRGGSQPGDVEINVNGLLPHIYIVQRGNENGDTKGGKGANMSADAGQT